MELSTGRFVRSENIKRYLRLLETATDEAERHKIKKLLAEEQQKRKDAGDGTRDE